MTRLPRPARTRGGWLGALAAVTLLAAGAPSTGLADAPRATARNVRRAAGRASVVTVALGATSGEPRARALLADALSDAITQNPALRLGGADGSASLVLTANVRVLAVQHDPAGTLARCDVGLVVTDGGGAVRAMLDARRTVRADGAMPDDALARTVLRGAMDGAVHSLVAQLVP
jgi:hypothetical protein